MVDEMEVVEPKIRVQFKADVDFHIYEGNVGIAIRITKEGTKKGDYNGSIELDPYLVGVDFGKNDDIIGIKILTDNSKELTRTSFNRL